MAYHPNIIQMYGAIGKENESCIVLEHATYGALTDLLEKKDSPFYLYLNNESYILNIALQIARAVEYLHELGFIHRDLKTDNIVICDISQTRCFVKVCDFDISRVIDETMTNAQGTPHWMAPEVYTQVNSEYDESADSYSYGILLWQLFAKEPIPYKKMNFAQILLNVKDGKRPDINLIDSTKFINAVKIKTLIASCWHKYPSSRPDFTTIIARLNEIIYSKP